MPEIEDIFNGENVTVWKDEDIIFLTVFNVTVSFPEDVWDSIKKELKEL